MGETKRIEGGHGYKGTGKKAEEQETERYVSGVIEKWEIKKKTLKEVIISEDDEVELEKYNAVLRFVNDALKDFKEVEKLFS